MLPIVKRTAVLDRLARAKEKKITPLVDAINKLINDAKEVPIILQQELLGDAVSRHEIMKGIHEAGWRVTPDDEKQTISLE